DAPDVTSTTITGNITIPLSATPGQSRMRVIMQYDQPIPSACTNDYNYGETEDYCVTLMTATSIAESAASFGITAFPDPADHEINMVIDGATGNALSLSILDNTGREVLNGPVRNGQNVINTANMANGLYVYRVLQSEQEIGRGKFIISH
ncbi:MAG: T9SS type A sorting domain-containing protein, partial [Bacteroidota bacterium]|nr:T9SS type A sorting domain-containing protein [Bacteroidota bacterium]